MDKTELYNSFFNSFNDKIHIVVPSNKGEKGYLGVIKIETKKGNLDFDVLIPFSFPFGQRTTSIQFKCNQINGYEHQNLDNSICLHPTPNENINEKLTQEVELLLKWIDYYYVNEKTDSVYNYLLHFNKPFCMYFDSRSSEMENGRYGEFDYIDISQNRNYKNLLALNIGGETSMFSKYYQNTKEYNKGVWIYIEDEPIIKNRSIVQSWSELKMYVTQEQINYLYHFQSRLNKNVEYFFVMLGYKIFNSTGKELHWELIYILSLRKFTRGVKVNKQWISELTEEKILWCKSSNITYDRFFGRGRLHSKLIDANILIIGAGAIGSSLAKILVRCGVKKIVVSDFDTVESGNICRSEYFIYNEGVFKTHSLQQQLCVISPFVEVTPLGEIPKTFPGNEDFEQTKRQLSEFDIIFDCSTDMEMAYMLDKMKLRANIFNLSLTDMVKEFICVFGGSNIAMQKHQIFKSLNVDDIEIDFYPEAGCGYPTFRANYNDINTLLNFALNNINHKYENGYLQNTFVLSTNKNSANFYIEINEF